MFDSLSRKRLSSSAVAAIATLLASTAPGALAQFAQAHRPSVTIPHSNQSAPGDAGLRSHTNLRFFFMNGSNPSELPPFSGYAYETPASLACVYKLARSIPACNPNQTTADSTGGSGAIALVDAYDDPNAAADLAYFSEQFGLPAPNLTVVYAQGSQPPVDPTGGWELEEALDIEYAHAMAPKAKLYLVEANSDFNSDLFPAVQVASNLVLCGSTGPCPNNSKGKGEVSMSWGGEEFQQETSLDTFFTTPNVEYFAASGDSAGTIYPCTSVNVICVGGTSIARSEFTGNYIAEIAWSDAGGGLSEFEPTPHYQEAYPGLAYQLQGSRGVPDVSAVANPVTGVWEWDTFPYETADGAETGWFIVGGTSLATPVMASVFNASGCFGSSSSRELADIYSLRNFTSFHDITYGACGLYSGSFSGPGWDLCTGFGSPSSLSIH
jgi:kumamolisin